MRPRALSHFTHFVAGLAFAAGLHSLAGCANDRGAKAVNEASKVQSGAPLIIAADTGNNRITEMRDLTAAGWQSYGPSGRYSQPTAVAVDGGSRIYALDTQGTRLTRVNGIDGSGWVTYASAGDGQGQLQGATSVAIMPTQQKILIADTGNARVVRLDDMTGANWTSFTGSGTTALHAPSAVAADAAGRIYIGDGDHIVRLDSLDGSGWTSFGATGSGTGQFTAISGIAIDLTGRIYVADRGANRIVRFDDLTGANWVAFPGLSAPAALAVDTSARVTVVDQAGNRLVQIADVAGSSMTSLGTQGAGVGAFASPSGVALSYETAAILSQ